MKKIMGRKITYSFSMLLLAAVALLGVPAFADTLTLNLASPTQSANAGSTLSFNATAFAPAGNLATIFLNGDSANFDSPLMLNDDGFLSNFPLSMAPNTSFTGLLFTVTVPVGTASGLYKGSFEIQGGANGDAQNLLATVNFNVNVPAVTSAVPEPESLMLLMTGLPGLAMVVRSKRHLFVRKG